jgi:eukaryotic-like serine/threonine-protein kinase
VAVKVLPGGLASNAERLSRFDREARSVSQLSHPHVCTLHDVGEEDGIHFLVLRWPIGSFPAVSPKIRRIAGRVSWY